MPQLKPKSKLLNERPIKLVFNVTGVAYPAAWQGDVLYDIKVLSGKEEVVSSAWTTMPAEEIEALCDLLEMQNGIDFEPESPDFSLALFPQAGEPEDLSVVAFIDEAIKRASGYIDEPTEYTGDSIGVRIIASRDAIRRFGHEIREQYIRLTKDLRKYEKFDPRID